MNNRRYGLSARIVVLFCIVLLVISTANLFMLIRTTNDSTLASIQEYQKQLADRMVGQFDTSKYRQFMKSPSQSPEYWELREALNDLRLKTNSKSVFTLELKDGNKPVYVVDGMPKNSKKAALIGEEFTVPYEQVAPAFEGRNVVTGIIHDPKYGEYFSTFMPLKDSEGNVVGVLGVNTGSSVVNEIRTEIAKRSGPVLIGLGLLSLLALLAIWYYIFKQLKSLNSIRGAAHLIAQGRLSEASRIIEGMRLRRKDEIYDLHQSFVEMTQDLTGTITQVKAAAMHVAAASQELSAGAAQIKQSSEQVAETMSHISVQADASALAANETATALGETAVGVQRIAESSSQLAERSLSTQADSAQGVATASSAVEQMQHVSGSVDDTARVIQSLEESSGKISAIIEAIAAITKQTNLLALNASIEAARAGEHGRGFSVVAQEIRKLSEQSKASADEIAEIIGGIIEGTKEAASSMDRSKAEVHRGIGLVNEAGSAFNRILEATESLAEQIHEVSAITQEISASTEQVTASSAEIASSAQTSKESIGTLAASTKEQLDTIQQIAESASQLSELAIQLQRDMDKFAIE